MEVDIVTHSKEVIDTVKTVLLEESKKQVGTAFTDVNKKQKEMLTTIRTTTQDISKATKEINKALDEAGKTINNWSWIYPILLYFVVVAMGASMAFNELRVLHWAWQLSIVVITLIVAVIAWLKANDRA